MFLPVLLLTIALLSGQTPDLFNGDFETGDFTGWTADGINGGFAVIVSSGDCFSANNTRGISLYGRFSANIRSNLPGDVGSAGVLTSDPFEAGNAVQFQALCENDDFKPAENPVTLRVRILDPEGKVLRDEKINPNVITLSPGNVRYPLGCYWGKRRDGPFSEHTLDTADLIGQTIRVQFMAHTNVQGWGFFTLIDNVRIGVPSS